MKLCLACAEPFISQSWRCPSCEQGPAYNNGVPMFAPELSESNEGFHVSSFEKLYAHEADNFWFEARNRLIQWAIGKYFNKAENFLEIGCGTGFVLNGIKESFPNMTLNGSEIYVQALEFAKQRLPDLNLVQMNAMEVPYLDEFDLIGLFDVLEHIKNDQEALIQIRKALKSRDGGLILTVPQHQFLWSESDELSCHFRRYEAKSLLELLDSAGFHVLRMTSFVTLLLPAMVLSRCINFKKDQVGDPYAEFHIPEFLNKCFYLAMRCEHLGIRLGLSYPVGGSLLVVARVK